MTLVGPSLSAVGHADPDWCTGHYEPSPQEAFHQHSFTGRWGKFDEQASLGLTRFDSAVSDGEARLEIQHCDGEEQGSVSLTDAEAGDFAGSILGVLAIKNSASHSRLALYLRCAYEVVRASTAAFRYVRTASPRTAESHNRSIRSV